MSGVPVTAGTVTRGEATGGGGVQVARLRRGRRLNPPQALPSTEGSDRASSSIMGMGTRRTRKGRCMSGSSCSLLTGGAVTATAS